jgi:hypothetical protein
MKATDDRNGRRFSVPASRRLTWDLLHFNRRVPLCGHDRLMSLEKVMRARSACSVRVSWPALFLKAFALAALEFPELRQTWYRFPWAHLYQHPFSVGVVTVQRSVNGIPWLFWGKIARPEELSLDEIQRRINEFMTEPVERVFAQQWRLAHLPTILRRIIWWFNLNVATRARAKRLGTFFLSTLAGRGAEIQMPPSIHTGCLTFGPLDSSGCSRVTLAYDHRVMDGAMIAEILVRTESILNTTLTQELDLVGYGNAVTSISDAA